MRTRLITAMLVGSLALSACGTSRPGAGSEASSPLPASGATTIARATPTPVAPTTTTAAVTATNALPSPPATDQPTTASSAASSAQQAGNASQPAGDLPIALAIVEGDLVAVSAGIRTPRWSVTGGRAALDGSSAFVVDGTTLLRIDLQTGRTTDPYPLPAGADWRLAVVGLGGRHVVVTDGTVDRDHPRDVTKLAVVDTTKSGPARVLRLPGTIEPEAVSSDGGRIFVLDHSPTYYRVRSVDAWSGVIEDTLSRAKEPAENMHGEAVRAVLGSASQMLATLYRDLASHPFVHLLNLDTGYTYCADLPAGDFDRISATTDATTLLVGATDGRWASIDVRRFTEWGVDVLPVEVHVDGASPVPLTPRGALLRASVSVAAEVSSVVWRQGADVIGEFDQPVDRLVALAAGV